MLRKNKGFTMIEMLTALLLLGLLMLGISSVMSSLSAVSKNVDTDTNPNKDIIYILQEFQKDASTATRAVCKDGDLLLYSSSEEPILYAITANKLYRQSRYLADVIHSEFSADDKSFSFRIVLKSHELLETKFYLKGAQ